MKPIMLVQKKGSRWCCAALLGLTMPTLSLLAADTNTPQPAAAAPQTNAPALQATAPASQTNAPAPPQAAAPASATNAPASKTTAPAPLTPEQMFEGGAKTYNNWIDLSTGGFISSGNKSQFQQRHQTSGGAFGGIEDFHYQADVAKDTTLTKIGRAHV